MSDRMMRAAEDIGRRARGKAVEHTAERLRSLLPSASVQTQGDQVVIEMSHLVSSWLNLSELRFFGREFF